MFHRSFRSDAAGADSPEPAVTDPRGGVGDTAARPRARLSRRSALLGASGVAAGLAATLVVAGAPWSPAPVASADTSPVTFQLLAFNDFHGRLEPPTGTDATLPGAGTESFGGAAYLATHLAKLREGHPDSLTVAAGDVVGSAPYLSGLFRDEPAVEAMNALKLDVSSVGNHEFDRGVDELLRLKYGGCSPTDGCPGGPFMGAAFDWLAGNVAYRDGVQPTVPDGAAAYGAWFSARTGRTVLPATSVRTVAGIKVGFIGLTLKGTSGLVRPQGVADVAFTDEVAATKLAAEDLTAAGAKAIVLLLHEGGYPPASAPYSFTCGSSGTVSGTVASLAKRITPDVDMIVSGHTHQPYLCDIPDPSGAPRWVTSAASFSRSVVEASIPLDPATGDVVRSGVTVVQHAVTRDVPADAAEQALVTTWRQREADSMIGGARRVGTLAAVATRSVSMSTESSLADLVADAQLEATAPQVDGASVAAFVDPVTIHGDLGVAVSGNRAPVAVSYKNAYRAMPLNHLVYSMTLTGAQIDTALEQQWRLGANGTVTTRMLGISGLTYTWSRSAPVGAKVDPTSIRIRGVVVNPVGRYRVTATSFMASGSSPFTVFKAGTNRVCGGIDLPVLRMYLANHVRLVPPTPTRGTSVA